MLPFEFVVPGPPLSHQTRNRRRLAAWRKTVRAAAAQRWPAGLAPVADGLHMTVVYYHERTTIRLDNDNMLKPIQDALNGLIYVDDRQVTDTSVRKTRLDGEFRARGMSPVLAEGFVSDREFLHVTINRAPSHAKLLP